MADIQETHSRTEGAPKNFVAAELNKKLDETANFKGCRLEQWLLIDCKQNRFPITG